MVKVTVTVTVTTMVRIVITVTTVITTRLMVMYQRHTVINQLQLLKQHLLRKLRLQ